MTVRQLGRGDAAIFRGLRREALLTNPEAFVSTVAYLDSQSDDDLADRLETLPTFVAFNGDTPCGLMAYMRETGPALDHRAVLINVFVTPDARGSGVADALLEALLKTARDEGILQVELGVTVENTRAIAFYQRSGFAIVGTIPRGFRHAQRFTDEHLMVVSLDT